MKQRPRTDLGGLTMTLVLTLIYIFFQVSFAITVLNALLLTSLFTLLL